MSDKPPTIIRAPHGRDNPFVMIRRNALQEKSISWAARGLLAYLLSRPDNWEIQIKDLQQGCGRNKVYALLNELIQAHYVKRETDRDDKHHITRWYYQVYEIPYPDEPKNDLLPENLEVGKLEVGNGDTYIYESQQDTEGTTDKKTLAPPENGAVTPEDFTLYDKPAAPGNISDKKWNVDMPVHRLGEALGVLATDGDWSNYKKVANALTASEIDWRDFPAYVQMVRNEAASFERPWTVTLNSLDGNGRMSRFVALSDADKQRLRQQAVDPVIKQEPEFTRGMKWIGE